MDEEEVGTDPLGILTKPSPQETGTDPLGILKKKDESGLVSSKDVPGLSGLQQKLSEKNTQSDLSSNPDERSAQLENQYQVRMMTYKTAKEDADRAMADAFRTGNELAPIPSKKRAAQDSALKKKSIADSILKEADAIRSGKYTDTQKKETALDVIEGKRDTQDPISALVNTIKSGIADQLPKEYYAQRLRMSKGSFGDLFDPRSDLNAFGDKLPKGLSREEFYQWNNAQPDQIRTKSYDERAKMFIIQRLGADGYERLKQQFTTENTGERLGFEKELQQQNTEAQARTKGVVQSLKDVHGAMDFLNFAGNMIGQSLYRAPTSILTGTMGSVVAESSSVYDRQMDLIAKKEGISREEVISRGLDKPAEGQALAVLAGTLDAASSTNLMGLFRNAVKKQLTEGMVKQFAKEAIKGAIPEAITEAAQGEIEEYAASKGAGTEYTPDLERIATSAVGGVIGGGVLAGATSVTPAAVVQEQRQLINPENPESIESASKKIEDTINEGTYVFDIPKTEAVQPVEIPTQKVQENRNQEKIAERVDTPTGEDSGKIEFKNPDGIEKKVNDTAKGILSGSITHDNVDKVFFEQHRDAINKEMERQKSAAKEPTSKYFKLPKVKSKWSTGDYLSPNVKQTVNIDLIAPSQDTVEKEYVGNSDPDYIPSLIKEGDKYVVDDGHHRIVEKIKNGEGSIQANVRFTNKSEFETQPKSNDTSPNKPPSPTEQPSQPVDAPMEQPPISEGESGTTDQSQASDQNVVSGPKGQETRTYAIARRILDSDASDTIKNGIKQKGTEYVPKGITVTDSEAKNLIELYGEDKSESLIRDTKNDITGDTRTALAARLYEKYKDTADNATDERTKQIYYDRAIDIALTSAEQLKEAGRQTNAAKIWKAITQSEDMTVLAIEKESQRQAQKLIEPIYKEIRNSKEQFDEQVRRIIAQKVTEGVEANLKRAKLITKEKRQQISDAFDKLKIKGPEGTLQATTLVPEIYNSAVEAVKRAVLAGADLANAVQAGVDYVRDNFKGEWDENEFRSTMTPAVEQMIPKETVDASEINQDKIKTPKISGKGKKNFINQVVESHNAGTLTDDKFDQLYAKELGAKEFSSEDRLRIRGLAKTIAEVESFESKVKDDFTRENIANYKSLLDKASKANDELQKYAQKPPNIWDTLISIMQGNLLTPLSLITNIYSNTALQPLRFLSSGIGSFVDYGVSQLAKTGLLNESYRDRTIDMAELQKGYFQGNWNGLIEGAKQLKSGGKSNERSIREINAQFSPVRAIARWSDKNRSAAQKANDYVEGTIGLPAEIMFRLLNLGDKPFRRGAELARAMEIAKQKGLKGTDLEKFIMFPDEVSSEQIKKAGDDATFQQDSASAKFIQDIITKIVNAIGGVPVIGGPLKVLAKSQIPYVKTPWNIMTETLQYAAFPITGAVGIRQIAKGDKRSGSILIGKAIVGAMIFGVAKELFTKGLLSWDEPYDQKKGKQRERRQIQYDNIPPNALNVSAIQRGLLGDTWDIKDDDAWIDYSKLGVMGLLFDNYANNYFSNIQEKGQMPEESNFYVDMLTTAPRLLSQSLEQSFLKGTNTLLTAIQDGGGYETEQWLISTSGALAAIVYPNTVGTISKSEDEFIRDTRDDSFVEKLKNTYKVKLFAGEQLPPKINLWGDKVTGNPEGRNKYAYYLFDPTKFKNVDTNNFRYRLYEAWKKDKFNDDWLPSIPKRDFKFRGHDIHLNGTEYSKLSEYVGKQRAYLVSTFINSGAIDVLRKEDAIKQLELKYSEGMKRGKEAYIINSGLAVKTNEELSKMGK